MKREILSSLFSLMIFFALTGCGEDNQSSYSENMREESFSNQQSDDFQTMQPYYGQISSQKTDQPSSKYPHTKAVQIQHAKYAFITVDEKGNEQKIVLPDEITQSLPKNVQQMKPEDITKLLPQDISRYLPKGSEQLTPEVIAKLIKNSGTNQAVPRQNQQQPAQSGEQAPADQTPAQEQTPAKQEQTPVKTEGLSELEQKVIELTNQERRKNGLSELKADASLSNVARTKSKDMQANNYFSHTSPTYGSPFDMMRDFGISYNAAAENIAQGQQTAEQVVQAWMNSEGHRANILNGKFTHIGVGHDPNGNYWTQMFISK